MSARPRPWRWILPACLVAAVILMAIGVFYVVFPTPIEVHAEGGPIEATQPMLWAISALAAVLALFSGPRRIDRLNGLWIATLAMLAYLRELDMHDKFTHGQLGAWSVSFKLTWWLDPAQPLPAKLVWGAALGAVGLALVLPPILVRAPAIPLLRRGDAPTWLFFIALGCLGAGYVLDDILGRGTIVGVEAGQAIEEIAETLGASAFLASAVGNLRRPLSARLRAIDHRKGLT